jgi:hypothetical protein
MSAPVDGTFDEAGSEQPSAAPPVIVLRCKHCSASPVYCETHAAELVALAFADDDANTRDGAARGAERELRRGRSAASITEDATAIRHVLVRWFKGRALAVARELVRLLEAEGT